MDHRAGVLWNGSPSHNSLFLMGYVKVVSSVPYYLQFILMTYFWNLRNKELVVYLLESPFCRCCFYADDIALIAPSASRFVMKLLICAMFN